VDIVTEESYLFQLRDPRQGFIS